MKPTQKLGKKLKNGWRVTQNKILIYFLKIII
jgi:hypothetical protein